MTHGLIDCTECRKLFSNFSIENGCEVWGDDESIRLINNPATWGSSTNPVFYLLGFSKGETQNNALAGVRRKETRFEDVPFKGMRHRLKLLLNTLGLIETAEDVSKLFERSEKRCSSGSLIKCSISARTHNGEYSYKMKDILDADATTGGKVSQIVEICSRKHLSGLASGRIVIMLGLDKDYIKMCRDSFAKIYGSLGSDTEIDYWSDGISWIHVAHPSGSLREVQYKNWVNGNTAKPKVVWARNQVQRRKAKG